MGMISFIVTGPSYNQEKGIMMDIYSVAGLLETILEGTSEKAKRY